MTNAQPSVQHLFKVYPTYRIFLFFLALLFATACSDWRGNNTLSHLTVELWYQQQAVSCTNAQLSELSPWHVQQMAFFISELSVLNGDHLQVISLAPDNWQNADTALVSFSSALCQPSEAQNKPAGTLWKQSVQFSSPVQTEEGSELQFTLGLPFAVNHLNPLTQPEPLNQPAMFWSWRGGHKFLRLDMESEQDAWHFHLGSTGCTAASAMRSPQQECIKPNRVQLSLPKQQQGERLIVHLDKLLEGVELNAKSSCLMQENKISCEQLMGNFTNNAVFEWR